MTRRVNVVPHTHWDREWYAPFAVFRQKLTDLLDELIPRLEADAANTAGANGTASAGHFLLDGQLAVIDDYLELRPQMATRIAALGAQGLLGIGPWYILMDEFLVSGETIVRNLQLGMRRAEDFGGAMRVGYLPDMFGHIAQMPQLLRLAGIEHAVVWRGTPRAVNHTAFAWVAPDGSRVRAEYLPQGYGNGAFLPDDATFLLGRVDEFVANYGDLVGDAEILWMNGTDHQLPAPWLTRVLRDANERQDRWEFVVGSLAEHVARGAPATQEIHGELRSGARANLLMGVASNRIDIKQAAAATERALERVTEPMCALFTNAEEWPQTSLDLAWREVIRNSAHDSICGCSHDDVCADVLARYATARHTAEVLAERALYFFGVEPHDAGTLLVNTTAHPRVAVATYDRPGHDVPAGLQALQRHDAREVVQRIANTAAAVVVERELEIRSEVNRVVSTRDDDTGEVTVELHAFGTRGARTLHGDAVRELAALAEQSPQARCTVVVCQPPRTTVAHAVQVPAFGWCIAQLEPHATSAPVVVAQTATHIDIANGSVLMRVDRADGTFSLTNPITGLSATGFGRMVDDGDAGDTYNYSPPANDQRIDGADSCVVEIVEAGPVRAQIRIAATWTLPSRIADGQRVAPRASTIVTTLTIQAGEAMVRVEVDIDNVWHDHRLRAHLPLPIPAAASEAECAFAIVTRGLEVEGGPTEHALATFPSRRFVRAGGLTVIHDGLVEYELVDIAAGHARTLALTLLRCTGMLSQGPMAYRPLPAGPETALDGAQLYGRHRVRYALAVDHSDPYALADAFTPFLTVDAPGGGALASRGRALTVAGAEVSSVQRAGDDASAIELRMFNPHTTPAVVRIDGLLGEVVDLCGQVTEPFHETCTLAPWAIATVRGQLTNFRHHHRHRHPR